MTATSERFRKHVGDERLFQRSASCLIVSSCLGNMVCETIRSRKRKGKYAVMTIIILSMLAVSALFGVMYNAFGAE